MMAKNPPLKLINKGNHRRILGIEQENLLRRNDRLNMLQIDHNRPLTAEDGGGVGEERVEDPEIAGRQPGPPHDGVLPDLHRVGVPRGVEEQPRPHSHGLLPERAGEADGGGAEEGLAASVVIRRRGDLVRGLERGCAHRFGGFGEGLGSENLGIW